MEKIDYKELSINPITLIGKRHMLLTAGNEEIGYNVMTVSWGQIGELWDKPVMTVYVRPSRYTKTFIDKQDYFTLSVLPEDYRRQVAYCGTVSGMRQNKFMETGLTPVCEGKTVHVGEAELVFKCRKIYQQPIEKKGFLDMEPFEENYSHGDIHVMYVGEIVEVLKK
ncbi:MAG: flavin reductase family protein [Bacteroidaceae bacterium]|nr:flavin reductase family protein [Bacteroidaceae bacterium]